VSVDLSVFAMTAASKADAAPRQLPEHVLLEPVGNLLLDMLQAAVYQI
jgi:hypothetical protein